MRPLFFHAPDDTAGEPAPSRGRDETSPGPGPAPDPAESGTARAAGPSCAHRLTMLLSSADWRPEGIAEQLPRVLQPAGIQCLAARSGDEVQDVIRSRPIHIAVIDLAIPLCAPGAGQPGADAATKARLAAARAEAGARILQLLRRLEAPPPTIVIRPAQPSLRDSARGLSDALREGAFAVLDRPLHLEAMLEAVRRIVVRHYAGLWGVKPAPGGTGAARWRIRRFRV